MGAWVGPHGSSRAPDALLLREEGGDVGLRLGALGGPGVGVQRVLGHDALHDGVHRLPLPAVLQLRCTNSTLVSPLPCGCRHIWRLGLDSRLCCYASRLSPCSTCRQACDAPGAHPGELAQVGVVLDLLVQRLAAPDRELPPLGLLPVPPPVLLLV